MSSTADEGEETATEALTAELWEWLVLPRLHPSDARAVGRCSGSNHWMAFLAAQVLQAKDI